MRVPGFSSDLIGSLRASFGSFSSRRQCKLLGCHPPQGCVRTASLYCRRHASILLLASASDKNQCASRHSSRKRPLNNSTKALSVGLPGREKSNVTPFS